MTKRNGHATALRPAPVVTETAPGPVEWEATHGDAPSVVVTAQAWFTAREIASRHFNTEPGKVAVRRK